MFIPDRMIDTEEELVEALYEFEEYSSEEMIDIYQSVLLTFDLKNEDEFYAKKNLINRAVATKLFTIYSSFEVLDYELHGIVSGKKNRLCWVEA
jgi:hypothetical protein